MALYVVLHHRRDPHQPWKNAWETDERVTTIMTTPEIARAAEQGGRVFVHRCAFAGSPARVVCEARVVRAVRMDRRSWFVEFEPVRTLDVTPSVAPERGTNSYQADPPP